LLYKFRYFLYTATNLAAGEKEIESANSFDEVVKENGLTEHEIRQKEKYLILTSCLFFILSSAILILGIYRLVNANFLASILAIGATFITFTQACRYHYYYFCLRNRVLSCSFNSWFNGKIEND